MDLDRTLFDTRLFFERIWSYAAGLYGLDAETEMKRSKQFYDMYGESYDYRFFDHLRAAVGPGFDQEDFARGAAGKLSGQFLYEDVTDELVGMIHAILTFGNQEYQTFKLSFCPELSGIRSHIVLEPKGEYIAKNFAKATLLVDDKDLSDEIVAPARFVRIDRSLEKLDAGMDGVINTLESVPAILRRSEQPIDKL